ncbi:MAG: KUP/HAK/KT family potassium transporter, partial [Gemmatimonadales bacterium]
MRGKALAALSVAALGVVYGDIGTSPLYALKECFTGLYSVPLTVENVLGVLSLIFWSLNFIVSLKYLAVMMRADNRGEGGIMALLALIRPRGSPVGTQWVLVTLALFGSSLLYGDGIITPAITVLGAMEGLAIATPAMEHWVVPLTVAIIIGLFFFQRRGTAGVGAIFGPVMVVWFASIAVLGIRGIVRHPGVLRAIAPWYAADFFLRDRLQGFLVLAAVVLVVT